MGDDNDNNFYTLYSWSQEFDTNEPDKHVIYKTCLHYIIFTLFLYIYMPTALLCYVID